MNDKKIIIDTEQKNTNIVKPYGDTLNDGRMQLSFSLPAPANALGEEAAKRILKQMGLEEIEICNVKDLSGGFIHIIAFASTTASVDLTKIKVNQIEKIEMSMEQIDEFIEQNIGRKLVVIGACIESDAHTVGIDAIMNMKGYNHRYGLERYRMIEALNLGAQVPVEELIERANKMKADAILVSQIVTQKNIHVHNLTRLIELAEAERVRERMLFICGGPRISNELAMELGYDAGFGPNTYANDVAYFIAKRYADKKFSGN
jgi:beta-lysine 5,6-aminomutase beta subunit